MPCVTMQCVTKPSATMQSVTMQSVTMPRAMMPRVTLGSKLYFEEDEQPHCILHWAIGALYSLQYSLQYYSNEDCSRTLVHILHGFRNSTQRPHCVCRYTYIGYTLTIAAHSEANFFLHLTLA